MFLNIKSRIVFDFINTTSIREEILSAFKSYVDNNFRSLNIRFHRPTPDGDKGEDTLLSTSEREIMRFEITRTAEWMWKRIKNNTSESSEAFKFKIVFHSNP